jgi:hypothetical protein
MSHAHIDASHIRNSEILHRVQKYILYAAAALAAVALIEHHPALIGVVAVIAVLAVALIERVISLPTNDAMPGATSEKYRSADGGSFRAGEIEKKNSVKQSVVVIDGGSKK